MQYCFETYYGALADMYNGLSQVDLSNWKEESISIQRVKQSVNFSGSKSIFSCILRSSEKNCNYVWTY